MLGVATGMWNNLFAFLQRWQSYVASYLRLSPQDIDTRREQPILQTTDYFLALHNQSAFTTLALRNVSLIFSRTVGRMSGMFGKLV